MAAKRKSSDKNKPADPYLESNNNPELEKKVDALMGVEEEVPTEPTEKKSSEPSAADDASDQDNDKSTNETDQSSPAEDDKTGAPLLPTDKLPDLEKEEPELVKVKPNLVGNTPVAPLKPEEKEPEPPAVSAETDPAPDLQDELGLEDSGTNKAVDEIIASDADELLTVRDDASAETQAIADAVPSKPVSKSDITRRRKLYRNLILLLVFIAIACAAAFPSTRYSVLNMFGARSASSVTVLDETTGQPLKSAEFMIAGQSGKTDSEGNVKIEHLRLGPTTMNIKKPAFAEINQSVTVGWGSNPLGEFRLKAVGGQYKFVVTDFCPKNLLRRLKLPAAKPVPWPMIKGRLCLPYRAVKRIK